MIRGVGYRVTIIRLLAQVHLPLAMCSPDGGIAGIPTTIHLTVGECLGNRWGSGDPLGAIHQWLPHGRVLPAHTAPAWPVAEQRETRTIQGHPNVAIPCGQVARRVGRGAGAGF